MKKLALLISIFIFISCDNNDSPFEPVVDHNPDVTVTEPRATGLLTAGIISEEAEALTNISITGNFPSVCDLSHLMPPVLNQGNQASCVAWATAYYLKSYQEKIQHNYEYLSDSEVMSPAFVYNQIITSSNCNQGTQIENALYILKTQGVNLWSDFSYTSESCANLPSESQLLSAANNKISTYHNVFNNTSSGSLINVLKQLLKNGNPIILGMKVDANFKSAVPRNADDIYVCSEISHIYDEHAMLMVGYDDSLNAFKLVNSWGDIWANEGFAYVHYDFFREVSDPGYQDGVISLHVAFDQ